MQKETELTDSCTKIMMSQIQQHFICNTLGTIEQLCMEQPEMASRLVHDFSLYLRGNFREMNSNVPIPLSQEIEHIRHYIAIEQIFTLAAIAKERKASRAPVVGFLSVCPVYLEGSKYPVPQPLAGAYDCPDDAHDQ